LITEELFNVKAAEFERHKLCATRSPLTHYRIVLVRDCPRGQCVVAKGSDSL